MNIYRYKYTYTYTHKYRYVCVDVYIYVYMYIYKYMLYIYIYIYMYVYNIYVYVYNIYNICHAWHKLCNGNPIISLRSLAINLQKVRRKIRKTNHQGELPGISAATVLLAKSHGTTLYRAWESHPHEGCPPARLSERKGMGLELNPWSKT